MSSKSEKSEKMTIEMSQADFDKVEKIIAETTAQFIEQLPTMVHNRLQGAVAKILGFENSWNEWRVDHCNGRMSVMSEYIGSKAKAAARMAVDSIEFKPTKEIIKAIKDEYAEKFRQEVREAISKSVEGHVVEVLGNAVNAHKLEIETLGRIPTKKDVSNPNYGKRPMEKLIMETLVVEGKKLEEGE